MDELGEPQAKPHYGPLGETRGLSSGDPLAAPPSQPGPPPAPHGDPLAAPPSQPGPPPAPHGDPLAAPPSQPGPPPAPHGDPLAAALPEPEAPAPPQGNPFAGSSEDTGATRFDAPPPDMPSPPPPPAATSAPPPAAPPPFSAPPPPNEPGTQAYGPPAGYAPAPAGYAPAPAGARAAGYGQAPAGPPQPTTGAEASPYALKRPIGRQIALLILSFGLWGFYWFYDTRKKLDSGTGQARRRRCQDGVPAHPDLQHHPHLPAVG